MSEKEVEAKKREQAGVAKERLLLEKKVKKKQADMEKKVRPRCYAVLTTLHYGMLGRGLLCMISLAASCKLTRMLAGPTAEQVAVQRSTAHGGQQLLIRSLQ
jgi:hypothetical protein